MSQDIKIMIETILKDEQFQKGVKNINKSTKEMAEKQGSILDSLKKNWIAFAAAIGGVVIAGRAVLKAYGEMEKENRSLTQAMKDNGTFTKKAEKEIHAYASSMQNLVGIDDDLVKSLIARGQTIKLSIEDSKKATEMAIGLAKATGMDQETAFKAATMALAGHTDMLRRQIPALKDIKDGQEGLAEVMEISRRGFNQAKDAMEGFSGTSAKIDNGIQDFKESLGETLSVVLMPFMKAFLFLIDAYNNAAPAIKHVINGLGIFATALVTASVATKSMGIAMAFLNFNPIVLGITAVVGAAVGLVAIFSNLEKQAHSLEAAMQGMISAENNLATAKKQLIQYEYEYNQLKNSSNKNDQIAAKGMLTNIEMTKSLIKQREVELSQSKAILELRQGEVESNGKVIASKEAVKQKTIEQLAAEKKAHEEYMAFMGMQKELELEKLKEDYDAQVLYATKNKEDLLALDETYNAKKKEIADKYDEEQIKRDEADKKRAADLQAFKESLIQSGVDAVIDGIADEKKAGKQATADLIKMVGTQIAAKLAAEAVAAFAIPLGLGIPSGIAYTAAAAGVKLISNQAANQIASFDVGTPSVQGDQVAQIHNGERIIPASMNIAGISNEAMMAATYRGIGSQAMGGSTVNNNNSTSTNVNINGLGINAGMNTTIGELINMADRMGIKSVFQRG